MPVINVPGIGDVFADGFAEEQTMQRILAVLSSADNMNSAEAQQRLASASQQATTGITSLGKETATAGQQTQAGATQISSGFKNASMASTQFSRNMNVSSRNLARSFSQVESAPFAIMQSLTKMAEGIIKSSGTIGKAVAGGLLGGVVADLLGKDGPLAKAFGVAGGAALGAAFGDSLVTAGAAVAGFLMDKLNTTSQAFFNVQKSGALLGGSFIEFRNIAHNANLTMAEFNNIFQKNGEAMASFGGQTLRGGREFARANMELNKIAGPSLRALGISFEDMGMATADIMQQFAMSGIAIENSAIQTRAFAEATATQLRQTKMLSTLTGRSIEQQKEAERQTRKDAQIQATLARLGPQQRDNVQKLISAFPQMREVILDQVTFGNVTSKNALMMAGAMPETTKTITDTVDAIKNGSGLVTDAFVRQVKNTDAIRGEFLDAADMTVLSRFSNNEFLKTVEGSFLSLQQIMTRSINNTVGAVNEGMDRVASGANKATNALLDLQDKNRELSMTLSKLTTEMLRNSDGLIKFMSSVTGTLTDGIQGLASMANINSATNIGPFNTELGLGTIEDALVTTQTNLQNNANNAQIPPISTAPGTTSNNNSPAILQQLIDINKNTKNTNSKMDALTQNLT